MVCHLSGQRHVAVLIAGPQNIMLVVPTALVWYNNQLNYQNYQMCTLGILQISELIGPIKQESDRAATKASLLHQLDLELREVRSRFQNNPSVLDRSRVVRAARIVFGLRGTINTANSAFWVRD